MGAIFARQQNEARTRHWAAFEAEALPHMNDLFRLAAWLVGDRTTAEDLLQETFAQALQSFHRYEAGTNCRAWLVTIMYHLNSKRLRSAGKLRLVSNAEERIAESVAFTPPPAQGISEQEVLEALHSLPWQFQEVVVLADVEEMAYKEIAEALSVPVGTVMSRLSRGRKLLRAKLVTYANSYGIGRHDKEGISAKLGGKSDAVS